MAEEKSWKNEYRNLKQRLNIAEKNHINDYILQMFPLNRTSLQKNEILQIQKWEDQSQFNRQKEKNNIFNQIRILKKDTRQFKEKLKCFERADEDLLKLQYMSENIEQNFTEFKQCQIELFDDIAFDQQQLEEDLELFEERLENFDKKEKNNNSNNNYNTKKQNYKQNQCNDDMEDQLQEEEYDNDEDNDNDNQDLEEFKENKKFMSLDKNIEFLENKCAQKKLGIEQINKKMLGLGGKNQGWTEDDQKDFLKLKAKHKNNSQNQAFQNACCVFFVYMEREDIIKHIKFHNQYCQLEDQKKEVMEQYKQFKQEIQQLYQEQLKEQEIAEQELKKKEKIQQAQKQKEQEKKKKQIQEWKLKKQAEKEIQNQNNQFDKKLQNYEKQQQQKYRQEVQRKQVQEYKEKRQIEKLRKQEQEQELKLQKNTMTAQDRERIAYRENYLVMKRLEANQQIQKDIKQCNDELKKQQRKEIQQIKYAHVDSKLNHVTTAAQGRQNSKWDGKEKKSANTMGGNILRSQGVAQVSWRQGL